METAHLTNRPTWTLRFPHGRSLTLGGRPRVMGILNLTPDSFSDGGQWIDPLKATERALRMLAEGADLLDLGAESTRPGGGVYGTGAAEVPAQEEIARLLPVLEAVRRATDAPISVDTRKGEVAERALRAGADLINDVSALADSRLAFAVAEAGCPVVLMHSRGELPSMQKGIHFEDVVREVRAELSDALARAQSTGIDESQVVLDPGIGFGKTREQNLALIARLDELSDLGRPLLLGASRKSFIVGAGLAPAREGVNPSPTSRLGGSLAAVAWAASTAAIVRVHDVAETVQLLDVLEALAS